ncbi:MAG: DUF2130 domain-containing protein [Armatimonadota bacterium]|nr:DUF2130 domain-containing protein [Armatimonadota bacterium]MDR7450865.1 DUF2130 domain-containing protein [Armatimonadota bacterium]MDR7465787.1 DUF2130 domain-containing protein [Armatimonadota bacterium]MDR7493695.1 DUF2130 domain-containing protein [Armatimonadota bacterium]MDR7499057.1 DUF2130 domain-containing protein [Armatimonadota bacterium]
MSKPTAPRRCPFCGQPLVNEQAIAHLYRAQASFERRLRAEAEKEARSLIRAEYDAKIAAVKAQAAREVKREMRAQLAAERKKMRVEMRREYEAQLKAARKDDRRVKQLEVIARRYREQAERQRAEADRQRAEAERLRRQLDGLQPGDRGEFNEEDLKRQLEAAFRDDEVKRVGRGRAGADLIQTVRYRTGEQLVAAGQIVYECKDAQDWKNEFVAQARQAQETHRTPHVILVTRVFPRKHRHFCLQDGIPVIHPDGVLHLAEVVRRMVIEVHRAGLSVVDRSQKTAELYQYLSGVEFRDTLADLIGISSKLQTELQKERRGHEQTWARREAAYKALLKKSGAIDASIRAIIERPVRDVGAEKVVQLRS